MSAGRANTFFTFHSFQSSRDLVLSKVSDSVSGRKQATPQLFDDEKNCLSIYGRGRPEKLLRREVIVREVFKLGLEPKRGQKMAAADKRFLSVFCVSDWVSTKYFFAFDR